MQRAVAVFVLTCSVFRFRICLALCDISESSCGAGDAVEAAMQKKTAGQVQEVDEFGELTAVMKVSLLQKRPENAVEMMDQNGGDQIQRGHKQVKQKEVAMSPTLLRQTLSTKSLANQTENQSGEQNGTLNGEDIHVCDVCDPFNPEVNNTWLNDHQGVEPHTMLCFPNTADVCLADPCDPKNPHVNHKGWWCKRGTSEVIVSSYWKQQLDAGAHVIRVNQPASEIKKFRAMYAIPSRFTYKCVPCDAMGIPHARIPPNLRGKWCLPGKLIACRPQCDPCDPLNPEINKKGWYCQKDTANVCVDEHGLTVVNYGASKTDAKGNVTEGVIYGQALSQQSCKDEWWCQVGVSLAALAVMVVTPELLGPLGAAAFAGGEEVVEGAGAIAEVIDAAEAAGEAVEPAIQAAEQAAMEAAVSNGEVEIGGTVVREGHSITVSEARLTGDISEGARSEVFGTIESSDGTSSTASIESRISPPSVRTSSAVSYGRISEETAVPRPLEKRFSEGTVQNALKRAFSIASAKTV